MQRIRQFVSFTAVGAIGTAAHYLVLVTGVELLGTDPVSTSFFGALIGALCNYFINHSVTFKSDVAHSWGLPRFLMVAALGLALNTVLMAVLVNGLGINYLLAQVLATAAVLAWNFLGSVLWAFNAPDDVAKGGQKPSDFGE